MKIHSSLIPIGVFFVLFNSCALNLNEESTFGAYYTKVQSTEPFEQYSRTGDFSDIIVDLGDDKGQLVFWRGANFLPYWKPVGGDQAYLQEIVPRSGDGHLALMPDRVNTYSHAKIIESNNKEVIIHWRYLKSFAQGNPHKGVAPNGFVDEYFTIDRTGEVHRTIRQGQKKSDDWNDPANIDCQTIILGKNGIRSSDLKKDNLTENAEPLEGNDLLETGSTKSVFGFNFNEGIGDTSQEMMSGQAFEVTGRKALWRKGVSGTCLQFDGYNTEIKAQSTDPLPIEEEISLQAFVALGAYPWSWCPIVQQCDDLPEEISQTREGRNFHVELKKEDDTGFFLGINGDGHPGLKIRVGGKWQELLSDFHMERRQWYLLTGTFSQTGEMKIYVDGELVGQRNIEPGKIELSENDILIGRGKIRRPINPVRENTFPAQFGFDGLIDEVQIFNVALSSQEISARYLGAEEIMGESVDMDERILPSGNRPQQFGAYYDHLSYYDVWDNLWCFGDHPDIVVGFDDIPSKFVFWRGVSYIPMMVNEKGQWYSNEFNETWGTSGGDGCQEPMSDKGNYFTYARILENTPARVVIHYRFPLADVNLVRANYVDETGWYDVADWYYYIYPDGIALKRMHLWTSGERNHEWQESMAIFGPDQHPEDIIEKINTVTMKDMDGNSVSYNWLSAPPPNVDKPENQCIQIVNYTGQFDPITIGEAFEGSNVYGGELTPYSVFPTWNHWPVAQMPSDGRYASYPDRTGHSSLTHVYLPIYSESSGDKPYYEKLLMEGMLDIEKNDLVSLAKSWNQAPNIVLESLGDAWYNKAQRAYIIESDESQINLVLNASTTSPLQNCCLVIKDWGNEQAEVKVNEQTTPVKQGIVRDTDGSFKLVIWIELESEEVINLSLSHL